MRIIYEGVDITDNAEVASCVYTDASGGRMDCLSIAFEHPETWYSWRPVEGDRLEIKDENGFSTGEMYVHNISPEDGRFLLRAYSARCGGKDRKWLSYAGVTLKNLADACAAECGMEADIWGLTKDIEYPYIIRQNETPLAFLQRVACLEGGVMKCVKGKLAVIGIEYAQELHTGRVMRLTTANERPRYDSRAGEKLASATIVTASGTATAHDIQASGGRSVTLADTGACSVEQAKRWARGWLMNHNRAYESMELCVGLDGSLTAMTPVEVTGDAPFAGMWLVDEARHDLTGGKTQVRLLRCVTTVE